MIECKNLTKTYHMGDYSLKVLDDVSLSVEKGEFLSIIGPSGSGKSTLMNILGALDKPDGGSYHFMQKNMLELSDDALADFRAREIGFVFQNFNLLSRATVLRNVMLPMLYNLEVPHHERELWVREALTAAGLEESRWHHLSNQLSGGQMQRVAIARALVNKPDLILADEPTGNLDSKTGEIILRTFQHLNHDLGHSIVLITHDDYIAEHSNRIVRIKDGKIVSDSKHHKKRNL